jgi:murein L,D-transpeptidase YcbB/YkuD
MRRPPVHRTPEPAAGAQRHAAALAIGLAALAIGLAVPAIAAVLLAACATGSAPVSSPTSARRGSLDNPSDGAPAAAPTVSLARDAILDAHLTELRFADWPEHRDAVERLYVNRGFTPLWIRKGHPTKSALEVIDLLEGADAVGLTAEDYDAGRWTERVNELRDDGATEVGRARFDLALTVSVMRYASDLHRGRIDPRPLGFRLGSEDSPATSFDLATLAEELSATSDVEALLASIAPPHPEYRRLLDVLDRYRELARTEEATPPTPFVASGVIEPGDVYADLPRLAELLARLGDLRRVDDQDARTDDQDRRVGDQDPQDGTLSATDDTLYAGEIVEAVVRFQRRHGLDPDGKIGEQTLEQLSTPLARRVRQIELALERWRWQPARLERPAIVVNLPEFRLRAFDERGQVAFTTDVVVGRAGRQDTPVFAERMLTVVFRPGWYVPASITSREIVPEIEKDPFHLAREGYEILGAEGTRDLTSPKTLSDLRRGALRLRQKPGRRNALGPVKFLFPNRWNVYLHGTPSTKGFTRARRDLSHGCIRVADPLGLAEWVLRDQPEWTLNRILETVSGTRDEVGVELDTPLPVHLVYDTVVVTEDGEVRFLDDLYGHDARLERAL